MDSRRAPLSSKLKMRRRKRARVLGAAFFGAFLLLLVSLAALLNASFLRIKTVSISGAQTVSTSTLAALVEEHLQGTYAWVFPKNNVLLYPQGRIALAALAAFPQLQSVSVHVQRFSNLEVAVAEREPVALWCGEAFATSSVISSSSCLLMDDNGVAYGASPLFQGGSAFPYTPYFGPLPGKNILPAQFLTPAQFYSLQALVASLVAQAALKGSGGLEAVALDSDGNVRMQFQSGFALLFRLADNAGTVLEHFTLALTSSAFTGRQLSDFQYLDLRFGDKLYYKLKKQ